MFKDVFSLEHFGTYHFKDEQSQALATLFEKVLAIYELYTGTIEPLNIEECSIKELKGFCAHYDALVDDAINYAESIDLLVFDNDEDLAYPSKNRYSMKNITLFYSKKRERCFHISYDWDTKDSRTQKSTVSLEKGFSLKDPLFYLGQLDSDLVIF